LKHDIGYNNKIGEKIALKNVRLPFTEKNKSIWKSFDKHLVQAAIGTKYKLGLGTKTANGDVEKGLADELHKPVKKIFQRRRVISNGINQT